MTAEIRQRHITHAISLTQHVREILITINEPFDIPPTSDNEWSKAAEAIDLAEVFIATLETLHANCEKPAAT